MPRALPLRTNVNLGLGVAFAVLLATAIWSVQASTASGAAARRREESNDRRIELVRLMSALRATEAGERGYLITGDAAFRDDYFRSRRNLVLQLQRTGELMRHDERHTDFPEVVRLTEAKIAFMDSTIMLFTETGPSAARLLVDGGRGRLLTDSVTRVIQNRGAMERAELAALESAWRGAQQRSVGIAIGVSVLTLAFLILAGIAINRDITKRLRAETALHESENRTIQILEAVPIGLFVVDVKRLQPVYANRASTEILGTDLVKVPLDQITQQLHSVVAGTDEPYPQDQSPTRRAMRGERVHVDDIEVVNDGRRKPLEVWASPITDEKGEIIYAISAFSDISGRRRNEASLRELTDELTDFYENAPYGYHSIDGSGIIVRINRTQLEWLGYAREEVLGRMRITEVLAPDSRALFERDFPRVKLTGMAISADYEMLRRDGTTFPVMISATAVRDEAGMFLRTRTSVIDLTERRRAETAERRARESAEAANRAKSDFLARMSHELRTPLNSIIGFSEVLEDETMGPLNPRQRRYVANVLTSGRQLLQLVNDVLDLSRIEAGRMDLLTTTIPVADVLAEVLTEMEPLAARKNLNLTREFEDGMTSLVADESRFRQIVRNLLANAIKYTPDGGRVSLCSRTVAGPGARDESWIEVTVTDTGIGIPAEDQQRIFGEFEQVDSAYVQEQEGTGLGLSVTRRLVELHGGRISVESAPGRGSTFTVLLPAKGPRRGETIGPRKPRGGSQAPLVLVVDDEPAAADLVTRRLQAAGYRVAVASSGDAALALARQLAPDLITIDILLPDRDGLQVLGRLKTELATRDIPVVVLSMTPDRARGFSLGAAAWFVKPVDRDELLRVARRIVPRDSERRPTALIIESDAASRQLATHYLNEEGFLVLVAETCRMGVAMALEHRPDLIKLDLLLADGNGFDVVRALRESVDTRDIPVLMCTDREIAESDQEELRRSIMRLLSLDGLRGQLLREVQRLSDQEQRAAW